jgi:hypothetical protein
MRTLLVAFALISFAAASATPYAARAETQPATAGTKATKNKKAKKPAPPTRGPAASPTPSSEPRDYKY